MCRRAQEATRAARNKLEIADLLRQFAGELGPLPPHVARVVRHITSCRTAALGGHVAVCDNCGHRDISYNSCRDRHCPKCQCLRQARWLEARETDLLPVEYFHVVFTVPRVLRSLFLRNQKVCYDLLFKAAAETLREVALTPDKLGARIGFVAVLHSWTQRLEFHPHVHCVVAGGGIDPEGTRWISCKRGFFLPIPALRKVFRGKLLNKIERAAAKDKIHLPGDDLPSLLELAGCKHWHVYAKPPFAGPEQVLRYISRYTHRIAISNYRLIGLEGREVTFRYRDRKDGDKQKTMTLDGREFVRRFLLHVVPRRFVRIRYYGILANATRKASLRLSRKLLDAPAPRESNEPAETWDKLLLRLAGIDVTRCPACNKGRLVRTETLLAATPWPARGRSP